MGCSLFSMVIYKMDVEQGEEYNELGESAMKQALSGTIPMYTDDGNYYVEETEEFTGMEKEAKKLAAQQMAEAEAAGAAMQMDQGKQRVVMGHNVPYHMQGMGGGYKRRRSSKRRSSKSRSSKRRPSKRRPSKRRPSKRRPSKKKKSTRRRKPTRK
jgi:hypothetical protein